MKKPFASFFFTLLFLCGCATVNPQLRQPAALRLSPQWRQPTGSNVRTLEVFVENHSGKAVELSDIALSAGQAAPTPLWRQVRPSGPVPAGGHAVAALCFTNTPPPFTLFLRAGDDGHALNKGMLVFWRTADATPLAAFAVHVSEWIKAGKVLALPEGKPVSPSPSAVISLPTSAGKTYGVFWIENDGSTMEVN